MLQVDLTGKNAVVTGATRGIGFGIAKALAKSGASVACIGTNEEKLNASVAEIVADGGSAKAYICNVADSEAVAKTAETIIADFNKNIDNCNQLINNLYCIIITDLTTAVFKWGSILRFQNNTI